MIFCWYERKWWNDKRYTKRDTYENDDEYVYDYDRFTVSKLVVVITVVAPQYLAEYGKYALLKVGSKCLRALTSAAFGW